MSWCVSFVINEARNTKPENFWNTSNTCILWSKFMLTDWGGGGEEGKERKKLKKKSFGSKVSPYQEMKDRSKNTLLLHLLLFFSHLKLDDKILYSDSALQNDSWVLTNGAFRCESAINPPPTPAVGRPVRLRLLFAALCTAQLCHPPLPAAAARPMRAASRRAASAAVGCRCRAVENVHSAAAGKPVAGH